MSESTFRKTSDALFPYICRKRSETLKQRRAVYKARTKYLNELLHSIPPLRQLHTFSRKRPFLNLLRNKEVQTNFFSTTRRNKADINKINERNTTKSLTIPIQTEISLNVNPRTEDKTEQISKNLTQQLQRKTCDRPSQEVQTKTDFRAGQVRESISNWEAFGAPEPILSIVSRYRIPFCSKPPLVKLSAVNARRFQTKPSTAMSQCLKDMIKSGAVVESALKTGYSESFRSAVTSDILNKKYESVDDTLKRGNWKSKNTVFNHYDREIIPHYDSSERANPLLQSFEST